MRMDRFLTWSYVTYRPLTTWCRTIHLINSGSAWPSRKCNHSNRLRPYREAFNWVLVEPLIIVVLGWLTASALRAVPTGSLMTICGATTGKSWSTVLILSSLSDEISCSVAEEGVVVGWWFGRLSSIEELVLLRVIDVIDWTTQLCWLMKRSVKVGG